MTLVLLALAALAAGSTASVLAAWRGRAGTHIGLASAIAAGALCILASGGVLCGIQAQPIDIEWPLPLGAVRLALDGLSAWFLLVIGLVAVPASIYSWGYLAGQHDHGPVRAFAALWCAMIAAMILVVLAADAVLFLIGWEVMSLSAFFLVGFRDQDSEARRGAWMYLVATHLGTAAGVLPLVAVLVARSGSTAFADFEQAFGMGDSAWCAVLFALAIIGFGTKAGLMPLHVWLPAAHPVAPSPVSALMSGVLIKTGVYGLLRALSWLPALPVGCAVGLLALGMITGVMGILHALGQQHIKRVLAYSSVENIGIICIAIALGLLGRSLGQPALEALGLAGALLHVLNHSLFKALLFLSAGAVLHDAGTEHMDSLGGLARRTPVNALAFLVGAAAICGLPPLNGFLSEFLIYTGLLKGLHVLPNTYAALAVAATAALALIGGLALIGFTKVFTVVFLGDPRDPRVSLKATPRSMNAGLLLLAAGCIVVSMSAVGLPSLLAAALRPMVPDSDAGSGALQHSLAALQQLALPLGLLVVIALALAGGRRRLPQGEQAGGSAGTWGCGFAAPAARMQYSASSFAWSMVHSLRLVLRSKRRGSLPAGCFPHREHLSTHTTDLALERCYRPLFAGVARVCARLWPLQHGRIQLYLAYIVGTVVVVFLVESTLGHAHSARRAAAAPGGAPSALSAPSAWCEAPP